LRFFINQSEKFLSKRESTSYS